MALTVDITMTLDGFIAGPNPTLEHPLGDGGDRIHEWLYGLASFRERHGMSGGTTNALTQHARERVAKQGGTSYTFVTDGIAAALDHARAAAGERDVSIAGGASVARHVTHLRYRVAR